MGVCWAVLFVQSTNGEPLATPDQWGPYVYWIEAEFWTFSLAAFHLIGSHPSRATTAIAATGCAIVYGAFAVLGWYGNATEIITPAMSAVACLFMAPVALVAAWNSLMQQRQRSSAR